MMQAMKVFRSLRKLGQEIDEAASQVTHHGARQKRVLLRNLAWVSAGVTALALGVVVGREVRQRYKFNRRTPYDFYAHSGDQGQDVEFGVGI
jgi:hypothetical protein